MKIVIIEDEVYSAQKLQKMILALRPNFKCEVILSSIELAISWFQNNEHPNLIFLDIHLSDGMSFELLKSIDIKSPIVFTTAYDQYAIQAFKYNSIGYLLKPIDIDDLEKVVLKYEQNGLKNIVPIDFDILNKSSILKIKKRFLVKKGSLFESIPVENIAFFKSSNKLNVLITKSGQQFVIDNTLDELQNVLDPNLFYRINRGMVIHISIIKEIHSYFNGRLKLDVFPKDVEEVLVSRERVIGFKNWLDN